MGGSGRATQIGVRVPTIWQRLYFARRYQVTEMESSWSCFKCVMIRGGNKFD